MPRGAVVLGGHVEAHARRLIEPEDLRQDHGHLDAGRLQEPKTIAQAADRLLLAHVHFFVSQRHRAGIRAICQQLRQVDAEHHVVVQADSADVLDRTPLEQTIDAAMQIDAHAGGKLTLGHHDGFQPHWREMPDQELEYGRGLHPSPRGFDRPTGKHAHDETRRAYHERPG